jgi:predicted nucleic acid-binding protein
MSPACNLAAKPTSAGSRFIVTGDSDLLRLGAYQGIQILKVADFLNLIG